MRKAILELPIILTTGELTEIERLTVSSEGGCWKSTPQGQLAGGLPYHTNIPTYARVKYRDIYPGIDLIYYGNQRQLEYDFVVAPGADPEVIRLAFDGLPPHPVPLVAQPSWLRAGWKPAPLGEREPMPRVFAPSPLAADKGRYHEPKDGKAGLHPLSDSPPSKGERKEVPSPSKGEGEDGGESRLPLRIDDNGDLILHAEDGDIRLHKPRIYQEINGVKHPIPGGYVLLKLRTSNLEPQQVSFQVAAYDTTKPLIIDPTLSYSTYLGGSGEDRAVGGIAVDSSGNAYVMGHTNSSNFPTTSPLQAAYGGGHDAFVTKLNAAGSALVYSTYLGGSGGDIGYDMAVDSAGNLYVVGNTGSSNFPTASPLQASNAGGQDAFVTKLNAAGSALVYSTYLGSNGRDSGHNVTVDASGNAYVAGTTESTNFPTVSPFQSTNGGSNDAFVTKLNAAGSTLVYSTYLGGSGGDEGGGGIAVDSSGNAYVVGRTDSTNFPTASPLQAANGGDFDVFVAKIVESTTTLTVTKAGTGSGTVTSSPAGINCGATCQASFSSGTSVTLTATADSGSIFDGWSGGGCSGTGTCTVTMNADTSVTATFTKNPVLSVTPTSLDFGEVTVGSTKDLTFTVTNSGGGTLTGSVTTSPPYSIVSGSSFSLGAGASQTVTVRFSPTSCGTFLGNVSVSSNGGSASVTLSGTGTGTYSISPTSQTFSASGGTGSVSVTASSGCSWTATSNVSWITITSGSTGSGSGTVSYTVEAYTGTSSRTGTMTIAGQTFTVTQDGVSCTSYSISPTSASFGPSGGTGSVSVTASSGCSWTAVSNVSWITITSGSTGSGNGTVSYSVAANDTTSSRTGTMTIASQTFTVTQSGAVPTLSVSPTTLAFGEVTVGSSSDRSFIVTNIGTGTLEGTATTSSTSFSVASGGSFTLTAGASQTVTVRFSPTSKDAFSGTVTVSSNGGSAVVSLSGTGTEEFNPLLSVFPDSLDFVEVAVNSSKDLTFTVSNAGTGTLTGTVTTTSPFSITEGSSFSLGTGASQVVTVRFSPTVEGFVSSTAAVNSNGGNASVTLTGTGKTTQEPILSVTPTSLDFGSVQVGSSSDKTFFVQNSGGETLIGTVSTSAVGFSIVSGTSFTLTAGATQTVTVRFSPPEGGTFSGTVTVSSNGGGELVAVKGVGEEACQPILTVTPSTLDFGRVRVGKSKDLSFTVQNTAECDSTLAGTATATDPFSVVTNSSFTVDAGDLVLVTVRFSPPTKGPFTGTVEFTSNGGDESATVMGRGWQLPFGLSGEEVVPVEIDIQPGGGAEGIDCQGAGVIEVRVFDVEGLPSSIAVETLSLEGGEPPQSWVTADVDGDGAEDDLVVHFGVEGVRDEACEEGVTLFTLVGKLEDGKLIAGVDEVVIVRGR